MAKEVTLTIIVQYLLSLQLPKYLKELSITNYASLSDRNILSKHQSGFHLLHSTVTALLEACNIDIGNVNAVAFLDQKKRHSRS